MSETITFKLPFEIKGISIRDQCSLFTNIKSRLFRNYFLLKQKPVQLWPLIFVLITWNPSTYSSQGYKESRIKVRPYYKPSTFSNWVPFSKTQNIGRS